jgi:hypothetical protein
MTIISFKDLYFCSIDISSDAKASALTFLQLEYPEVPIRSGVQYSATTNCIFEMICHTD